MASKKTARVGQLRKTVVDEVFRVAGLSKKGWVRKVLIPLTWPPAHRFAKILADYDADVASYGYRVASGILIQRFSKEVQTSGRELLPKDGPLVVASNHPGTYDAMAIMSEIPRDDMKVVVEDFPLFKSMTASSAHAIYTPKEGAGRLGVVRSMIRHLQAGGGILIFPSGKLDPDPSVLPGAAKALNDWSPSLEYLLRRVPNTQMVVTIVSGMLAESAINNPVTRYFDEFWMRLRVAEFVQLLQQSFLARNFDLAPSITFSEPIDIDGLLKQFDTVDIMNEIIKRAKELMMVHKNHRMVNNLETESVYAG